MERERDPGRLPVKIIHEIMEQFHCTTLDGTVYTATYCKSCNHKVTVKSQKSPKNQ